MGAAAEISRSRNQPNSFDREIEKATLRAGAAFSVESEGAIGINLPPIARVAAEFKVISTGELPNTQLNRQQLKCLIRYKLAAVSDIELPWKCTGFPLSGLPTARLSKFTGKLQAPCQTHSRFRDCRSRYRQAGNAVTTIFSAIENVPIAGVRKHQRSIAIGFLSGPQIFQIKKPAAMQPAKTKVSFKLGQAS